MTVRFGVLLWGLLLLSVAPSSNAQQTGIVRNQSTVPMTLEVDPNGGWRELLRSDGTRAIVMPGQCWQISDRSRAGQYRGVPQYWDAGTARYWAYDCWPWEHPGGICPRVDDTSLPPGLTCSSIIFVRDPRETSLPGYRGAGAPVLRP